MDAILVAGIGNIFMGDDAFGVEVIKQLSGRAMPAGVDVIDFGIRGIDLTYALLDRYDIAVLIDTTARGGDPGTLYVIEPEPDAAEKLSPDHSLIAPHELDPAQVLRTVRMMDGRCRRILLVGCEPATFGDEFEGHMGLSAAVTDAVGRAIRIVESLLADLTSGHRTEVADVLAYTTGGAL